MARPLRIEFAGAVYHVTSRGDRRETIYRDDVDRLTHLDVIAQAMERFDAQVLAYCLMGNHYHLVLRTRLANLSRIMRHINGVTSQAFNRRHGLVGHLFQGRFKAIVVDSDNYFLALCRYVECNPVAAGLVLGAGDWPWSSHRAHIGETDSPPWLDTQGLYAQLLGRPAGSAADKGLAVARYAEMFVADPEQQVTAPFWDTGLRQQIFLGDQDFVARTQARLPAGSLASCEVPKAQRRAVTLSNSAKTLQDCLDRCGNDRARALAMAYREFGLTMSALAAELDLSVSRISRLISRAEKAKGKT